jgi:uncharacterized protein (DUF1697 family)
MPVMVSLLRGVNVGGHKKVQMDALRSLYQRLGMKDARTYVQSGNVVFSTSERSPGRLAGEIESAIARTFGFRAGVVLRTGAELRKIVARNPFATRPNIHPGKLVTIFLDRDLDAATRARLLAIQTEREDVHLAGRELYVYFPDGMGRSKLWPAIDKALRNAGTARNWNTVMKLLEMAEAVEAQPSA